MLKVVTEIGFDLDDINLGGCLGWPNRRHVQCCGSNARVIVIMNIEVIEYIFFLFIVVGFMLCIDGCRILVMVYVVFS